MTTITEYGKQNIFANETPPRLMNEKESDFIMEQAERLNGQAAMLGFVAALGLSLIHISEPTRPY